MKTKFILKIVDFVIELLIMSLREMEDNGTKDADGVPLSKEYDRQGYLLACLRDAKKEFIDALENEEV